MPITHLITQTSSGEPLQRPLTLQVSLTASGVDITVLSGGEPTASVVVEVDENEPMLRVWDNELGYDNDPVIRRVLQGDHDRT